MSDLSETLSGREEHQVPIVLSQLEIVGDNDRLQVGGNSPEELIMDEQAERSLARFLDINKPYLAKCDPELKQMNINHWIRKNQTTEAVLEVSDNHLVAIHAPGMMVLPLAEVGNIVSRTFQPDNEVVTLLRDDTKFHIDIKTNHSVEVPADERIEGRQVGDITHGGVRMLASPSERIAPEVHTYLHRLWCTNGCTSPTAESRITLRGHTIPEVLVELEAAAQQVLSGLDTKLAEYAATAQQEVPGNPISFAHQLAVDNQIGPRLRDRIVRGARNLPDDATLYDVMNVFTAVASGGGNINYRSMVALQGLGGQMAFDTARTLHRCSSCERPLPE